MKITKITYALLCAATLVGVAAPSVTTFASTNESISQTALTNNSDVKDSVLDDEALNAPEPEYISWNDLSTDHQAPGLFIEFQKSSAIPRFTRDCAALVFHPLGAPIC